MGAKQSDTNAHWQVMQYNFPNNVSVTFSQSPARSQRANTTHLTLSSVFVPSSDKHTHKHTNLPRSLNKADMANYVYACANMYMRHKMCVCVSVFGFYTLDVILMECVLIRTRQNVSTSLDKGLWHGEWAATIDGGKEKDSQRRRRHLSEKRERWGETARGRWSGGQYFLWHPVIQYYNGYLNQ